MSIRDQRFALDKDIAYKALQDARLYVTDMDPTGVKAEKIYKKLVRASNFMRPWSTDGSAAQIKKAIEYLDEITSVLSLKIGPASRAEFPGQMGFKRKTSAQLNREIDEALSTVPKRS